MTKALSTWSDAWSATKALDSENGTLVANESVGRLSQLLAYLGRKEILAPLLSEIEHRPMLGRANQLPKAIPPSASTKWSTSLASPSNAVRSPFVPFSPPRAKSPRSKLYESSTKPYPLRTVSRWTSVRTLSQKAGLNYLMAFRQKGAALSFPAVMHWAAWSLRQATFGATSGRPLRRRRCNVRRKHSGLCRDNR